MFDVQHLFMLCRRLKQFFGTFVECRSGQVSVGTPAKEYAIARPKKKKKKKRVGQKIARAPTKATYLAM